NRPRRWATGFSPKQRLQSRSSNANRPTIRSSKKTQKIFFYSKSYVNSARLANQHSPIIKKSSAFIRVPFNLQPLYKTRGNLPELADYPASQSTLTS
ncbi:MAG TPA: hypothetical protein VI688_03210, partial [Anaerolineales bacterium]|nr:hypothetical protein [Anaerolineales bacterium]